MFTGFLFLFAASLSIFFGSFLPLLIVALVSFLSLLLSGKKEQPSATNSGVATNSASATNSSDDGLSATGIAATGAALGAAGYAASSLFDDDSHILLASDNGSSPIFDSELNPATGLPMVGMFDMAGILTV